MIFQGVPLTWHLIFAIPILIILYIFSFGMGLLLMHFGVTLNDLANLTNIGLRMVFYLSGIFYNITGRLKGKKLGPLRLSTLLLKVNPVAFCMNELRQVSIYASLPNFKWLGIWLVIALILCVLGIHVINKNENSYAKVI